MARSGPKGSDGESKYRLANLWQLRGRSDLAVRGYQQAIRMQPNHLPACLELSALWIKQENWDDAMAICQTTLKHVPDNPLLRERMAEIERRRGTHLLRAGLESRKHGSPSRTAFRCDSVSADLGDTIVFYTDCGGTGGAEQSAHLIMMDFARRGWRVICAQPRATNHLVEVRNRASIRHIWLQNDDLYCRDGPVVALSAGSEAAEIFEAVGPGLLCFIDGCPISSLAAKREATRRGLRFVIVNHCLEESWAHQFAPYVCELPAIYGSAVAVVAVSRENLDLLHRHFGLPPDKGRVIYNGCPEEFFAIPDVVEREQVRRELNLPSDAVVCMTVARMELMKGYHFQLRAMDLLRDTPVWDQLCFVWVGTGTLEGRLQAQAAERGVDMKIRFLGSRSDISRLLTAADIFLLPSKFEGMPLALVEAMARRLPVAATEVSGIPEALGETGQLLPDPRVNSDALSRQISAVVNHWANRPDIRRAVGEECHRRARELFSVSQMTSSYRDLLESKFRSAQR